jgi:NAD(P)-dependent dehydrogenase (short-subunit alcohol dehydrogenase family)
MSRFTWLISPPRCQNPESLRAKVQGKTVLITGASFGIGEATALLFAQAGAEVLLLARTKEKLEHLAQHITEHGGKASVYPCDLSKVSDISNLMSDIQTAHSRIDIVICNAGKSIRRSILQVAQQRDLERSLALNFLGHSALLLEVFPQMVARGGGQIINVSSVGVRLPAAPRWGAYQSSKAGFDVWLRSATCELRPHHIFVSSIYLPLVRTRMIAPTRSYDTMPALSPLEAAQTIAHAVVTRKARVAPWWLWWSELATLFLRTPIDRILSNREQRSNNQGSQH